MRDTLFPFQEEALSELKNKINKAKYFIDGEDSQVISFSAPTGSGKTIVMTALFEDILMGSDDFEADPEAIIVWLSDMPELNEQTRLKIESKSDKIKVRQLTNIDQNFDGKALEAGNIYFLNTQKLGGENILTQKSDDRQYTIWETISNTATAFPKNFYLIIDEAHRGMHSNRRSEMAAQSIMQKFIFGSEKDGLVQIPLIIGLTATPQRFQNLLADTNSTVHKVIVKPEAVRDSGLLKDRVILHYPELHIDAEMTMLEGAVRDWNNKVDMWKEYCESEKEDLVKPILVLQVEDGGGSEISRTDFSACLTLIEETLGRKLNEEEVVHTFNDHINLDINGYRINKVEASRINENDEISVVFFKMNLSTGWDCPRAETMMSFRSAQDYTYIAQLLGRMVRTPLARRIKKNVDLNNVHLFLPYYNEETVKSVITALSESEDILPPEAGTSRELVTLHRNFKYEDIFKEMENLTNYKVNTARKQHPLKRLMALARALSQDNINQKISRELITFLINNFKNEIDKIKEKGIYEEYAEKVAGFDIKNIAFDFGENAYVEDTVSRLQVTAVDINTLFNRAGKALGDGLHIEYWKTNSKRDNTEVKIEIVVIANNLEAMTNLSNAADLEFNKLYNQYRREIAKLPESRRNVYDKLLYSSEKPVPYKWEIGENIDFSLSKEAIEYESHLFVDDNGSFKTYLNPWEHDILLEEMKTGLEAWLRNVDRKSWALTIPYEKAGVYTSMYPDLIIVKEDEHGYTFDILEPHDSSRADNVEKAIGLAKFAESHWREYGRIQLIRKNNGKDGSLHYYRLDMCNPDVWSKVRSIVDNNALDRIFEEDAVVQEG